jgi:hypothetical protein
VLNVALDDQLVEGVGGAGAKLCALSHAARVTRPGLEKPPRNRPLALDAVTANRPPRCPDLLASLHGLRYTTSTDVAAGAAAASSRGSGWRQPAKSGPCDPDLVAATSLLPAHGEWMLPSACYSRIRRVRGRLAR